MFEADYSVDDYTYDCTFKFPVARTTIPSDGWHLNKDFIEIKS